MNERQKEEFDKGNDILDSIKRSLDGAMEEMSTFQNYHETSFEAEALRAGRKGGNRADIEQYLNDKAKNENN